MIVQNDVSVVRRCQEVLPKCEQFAANLSFPEDAAKIV
jgi:hypothetical protein